MNRLFLAVSITAFVFSCSPNNVNTDNSLERFFKEANVDGTFAVLNNKNGEITVYNLPRLRDSSFSPASTFKIVNSLIGLQKGVIQNDSTIIKWDGLKRTVDSWNKDLTMYEAFRVSAVPYYQEVARRIGKDTMQQWLDSLSYGNKKISKIDSFWLDHSLKITPDEQLGLVKALYFNQLPFFKRNQEIVKRAMLFEDKPEYRLSYKTGWTGWDSTHKRHVGWVVGWIEENQHPYFFVLNLQSPDPAFDMMSVRMKILKDILNHMGFMKGKK